MNSFDVAIPGSSYNYLDWRRGRPAGPDNIPVSEKGIPSNSRERKRRWNYYILESESSQSSDEGSESTLSIQGKETDQARDTSDLDSDAAREVRGMIEYEVMSSSDEEVAGDPANFVDSHQSSSNEDELVEATVIHAVLTEGDFMFADSEDSLSSATSADSEISPFDYWNCAQCRNTNNNPMFRYCEKCYKVRRDFFPPPPKNKRRKNRKRCKKTRKSKDDLSASETPAGMRRQSQGTALDFQSIKVPDLVKSDSDRATVISLDSESSSEKVLNSNHSLAELNSRKRKYESSDDEVDIKKLRADLFNNISVINNVNNKNLILSESYNAQTLLNIDISDAKDTTSFSQPMFSDFAVEPVCKSMSDPAINFSKDDLDVISDGINHFSDSETNKSLPKVEVTSNNMRRSIRSLSKDNNQSDMCITCLVEPKSGVFVHGRIAHICCCYKCSLKVWMKSKRCPICNCKVSNVLKAFVM